MPIIFGSSPAGKTYPLDHMLSVVRKSVRKSGRPGSGDPLGPAPPSKPGDYDPIRGASMARHSPAARAARRKRYMSA